MYSIAVIVILSSEVIFVEEKAFEDEALSGKNQYTVTVHCLKISAYLPVQTILHL